MYCLSLDFHELWPSMMGVGLFTEVKLQGCISTCMGDRFSALVVSLMALQLVLADQNPFRPY